jgi:DNA repair exonuclease SbcCD ATPase subunit
VSDSPRGRRQDYKDNRRKFEKELKVPYFVTYDPARQDLRVWRHNGSSYEPVEPNEQGRYPIPELELEIGLLDGWVRFWFRGELLPLPAELQGEVEALQGQLEEWRGQAEQERLRADQQQELAAQEKQRADQERQLAEQEKQRAEQEKQRADQERQVAEQEKQRAEQEKQRADQERQVAEQEKQRADALAAQVQELLKRLGAGSGEPPTTTEPV